VSTPVSGNKKAAATPVGPASAAKSSTSAATPGGTTTSTTVPATGSPGSPASTGTAVSHPDQALERILNTSPFPSTVTLTAAHGWTLNQVLIGLVTVAVLTVIIVPGLVSRRMRRRRG